MTQFYLIIIFIAVLGTDLSYAKDIYGGKSDQELLEESRNSTMGYDPLLVKYVYTELYLGMPEKEFVRLYATNKKLKEEELKLRIIKHKKNQYYLEFIDGKGRVTFKNGTLMKFEELVRDKPPFAFLVYSDRTYRLIGHKYFDGLYKWMPEDEFLSGFNEKIVKKYKEGYYSIKDKDGVQYGVTFLNGFLDDVWKQ